MLLPALLVMPAHAPTAWDLVFGRKHRCMAIRAAWVLEVDLDHGCGEHTAPKQTRRSFLGPLACLTVGVLLRVYGARVG